MIRSTTEPIHREPLAVFFRRRWLCDALREKVIRPEVLAELRRQRAEYGRLLGRTLLVDGEGVA